MAHMWPVEPERKQNRNPVSAYLHLASSWFCTSEQEQSRGSFNTLAPVLAGQEAALVERERRDEAGPATEVVLCVSQ